MAALLSTHGFRDQMTGVKYTVLVGALRSDFKCKVLAQPGRGRPLLQVLQHMIALLQVISLGWRAGSKGPSSLLPSA